MISHAADWTGAPKSLLALAGAISAMPKWEVRILLRRDGPMRDAMAAVAPTSVFRVPECWKLADSLRLSAKGHLVLAAKCWRNPHRPFCLSGKDIRAVAALKSDLQAWGVEAVYANTSHSVDVLAALELPVPVIMHVREMAGILANLDAIAPRIARNLVSLFLTASGPGRDALITDWDISSDLVRVEPPALDLTSLQQRQAQRLPDWLQVDKKLVIGAGTVDRRKGADLFLETAKTCIKELDCPEAQFVWLGEGAWREQLKTQAEQAGLSANVHFPGRTDRLPAWMKKADLLLMTSREDPYPRVMIEAGALAVPTLCFEDSGGAPEFVEKFRAGRAVPMADVNAMAEATCVMLKKDARLAPAQALAIGSEHDVNKSASRITREFERLLGH